MKQLLLLAIAALPLSAQTRFSATTGDASLSAAGTTLTLQRPATGGGTITLESATVYCSVACNLTQSFNGTAATATAGTATALPPNVGFTAAATVWTASNAGSGTAAGGIVHIPAGQTVVINFGPPVCASPTAANCAPAVALNGTGTAANYNFIISSITGTANITLIWKES